MINDACAHAMPRLNASLTSRALQPTHTQANLKDKDKRKNKE